MSKKTIGSHLTQLEKKGWLKRIKRWHAGNNYSGWFYDLDPTVKRLEWLTNLPQEKEQIPEDAEGPGLPEGSEAPVEVTPEPAAPPSYDHLRLVEPHPDLTEARLKLLTQVKRLSNVKRPVQRAERVKKLAEIREQRAERIEAHGSNPSEKPHMVSPSLEDMLKFMEREE